MLDFCLLKPVSDSSFNPKILHPDRFCSTSQTKNPFIISTLQQPQIILLKEGTDTSQGKPQLISNINACVAVADVVRTTLGPRGMDKLMHDARVRS